MFTVKTKMYYVDHWEKIKIIVKHNQYIEFELEK